MAKSSIQMPGACNEAGPGYYVCTLADGHTGEHFWGAEICAPSRIFDTETFKAAVRKAWDMGWKS